MTQAIGILKSCYSQTVTLFQISVQCADDKFTTGMIVFNLLITLQSGDFLNKCYKDFPTLLFVWM